MRISPALARWVVTASLVLASCPALAVGPWRAVPPPTPRASHGAAWDAPRQRLLVIGPSDAQLWALDLAFSPTWIAVTTHGAHPPGSATFVHDPVHGRLIAFAGTGVWMLPLAGEPVWQAFEVALAVESSAGVYDPVRDRVITVLPAGAGGGTQVLALALDGPPVWSSLVAGGGPAARGGASIVYDATRDRVVLFGGVSSSTSAGSARGLRGRGAEPALVGTYHNDTWAFSLASDAWLPLLPSGTLPAARTAHAAAYDAAHDRMVVFGGIGSGVDALVWSLPLAGDQPWTSAAPAGPAGRYGHTLTTDAASGRALLFGGDDVAVTWSLDLDADTWSVVHQPPAFPARRWGAAGVFDVNRRKLVVFGGRSGSSPPPLSDGWRLDIDTGAWQPFGSSGPSGRSGHTLVLDAGEDDAIVFGGSTEFGQVSNETWRLDLGTGLWTAPPVSGSMPARTGHGAIFDPVTRDMIVFGGAGSGGLKLDDVHRLDPYGVWHPIVASGTAPLPRTGAAVVFDPVRRRMLVFGGDTDEPYPSLRNDLWALSLDGGYAWSELPAQGPPSPRAQARALYDPAGDRLIVFGGEAPYTHDVWALPLAGGPLVWELLPAPASPAPPGRSDHVLVYEPSLHQLLTFAGDEPGALRDAWLLMLQGVDAVPAPHAPALALGAARPNPARDRMSLALDLPARARVVAEVLDVTGRRVARIAERELEAGSHPLEWNGRDGHGRPVPGGVYLVRVTAGGARIARPVVWLR